MTVKLGLMFHDEKPIMEDRGLGMIVGLSRDHWNFCYILVTLFDRAISNFYHHLA
jgi:hypothetical protein